MACGCEIAARPGMDAPGRGTQDATTWLINNAGPGRVESDLPMKTKTHFASAWTFGTTPAAASWSIAGVAAGATRRVREQATVGVESEWMPDMKCPGCGAEMNLIEVAPDKTEMAPGYEQRTFECSSCHDHVRQLVFVPRAIEPLNSEETRLSAAWFEALDKGTTPNGDESPPAVRAGSPRADPGCVANQGHVRGRDAHDCAGGLNDNLEPKFERADGRSRTAGSERPTRRCRPAERNVRHSDSSLKLR